MAMRVRRHMVLQALQQPEKWVITCQYTDKHGNQTTRTLSPIKILSRGKHGEAFLAYCLGREQPQHFILSRCTEMQLAESHDQLMPVDIPEEWSPPKDD